MGFEPFQVAVLALHRLPAESSFSQALQFSVFSVSRASVFYAVGFASSVRCTQLLHGVCGDVWIVRYAFSVCTGVEDAEVQGAGRSAAAHVPASGGTPAASETSSKTTNSAPPIQRMPRASSVSGLKAALLFTGRRKRVLPFFARVRACMPVEIRCPSRAS